MTELPQSLPSGPPGDSRETGFGMGGHCRAACVMRCVGAGERDARSASPSSPSPRGGDPKASFASWNPRLREDILLETVSEEGNGAARPSAASVHSDNNILAPAKGIGFLAGGSLFHLLA